MGVERQLKSKLSGWQCDKTFWEGNFLLSYFPIRVTVVI
jgi:hypothetical protein